MSFNSFAQCPTAGFSYSVTNSDVSVNDTSNGGNDWFWDWGDGFQEFVQFPPVHTYGVADTYTIVQIVTNTTSGCKDTAFATVTVGGGCNIVGNYTYMNDTADYKKILFTDMSTSPDTVNFWEWEFGDASALDNTPNPMHFYTIAGSFNVCLTIKDTKNCSTQFCNTINTDHCGNAIMDYDETGIDCGGAQCIACGGGGNCMANFNFLQDTIDPKSFTFNDISTSDSIIQTWNWDFGDATNSTVQSPAHVYSVDGTYSVCLTINSAGGCSNNYCQTISTGGGAAHCSNNVMDADETDIDCGGVDCAPCGGGAVCNAYYMYGIDTTNIYNVFFQDNSQADTLQTVTSWAWDFGDATSSNLQDPSHVYANNGDYWVCLTITTSDTCTQSWCDWVYGVGGGTDHCTNNIMDADETDIDCGGIDCGPCAGCDIYADFFDYRDTLDPMNLIFDNGSWGNPYVKVRWEFGDGIIDTINMGSTSHKYLYTGGYDVCLAVEDSSGCIDKICRWIEVDTLDPCDIYAYFDFMNDINDTSGLTLIFTNNSGGAQYPNDYYWEFGDGMNSKMMSPVHVYGSPGSSGLIFMLLIPFQDAAKCIAKISMQAMLLQEDALLQRTSHSHRTVLETG
ncbi:MAG: hypothetical protein JKY33_04850 [Bacteroidia bacterium]|nr:hypothetical protein [Bacteroidia bacterium]